MHASGDAGAPEQGVLFAISAWQGVEKVYPWPFSTHTGAAHVRALLRFSSTCMPEKHCVSLLGQFRCTDLIIC